MHECVCCHSHAGVKVFFGQQHFAVLVSFGLGFLRQLGLADFFGQFGNLVAAILAELLKAMMESKVLVPDHTEADLKVGLGGLLMHCKGQFSPTTFIEHHPGSAKLQYMDICVELPKCNTLVVLELKSVRRWRPNGAQQLNQKQPDVVGVDRSADNPRDVLREVRDDELRKLKCRYSGAPHTIDSLHTSAEEQARGYMTAIRTDPDPTKRTPTNVLGFAVTQVVDRFVVTKVALL